MVETAYQHHHLHHHNRRRHYRRMGIRFGILYGLALVAALCTLLILYFGSVGRTDLWSVLLRLLPIFIIMGVLTGLGTYKWYMNKYKKKYWG